MWHPDRNSSAEANERMKAANAAHHVLADAARRRRYDLRNGFIVPGTPHMRPPSTEQAETRTSGKKTGDDRAEKRSRERKKSPVESGKGWWRRLLESLDDPAGAAPADSTRTVTLIERRPRLTKYVLLPLGVTAILFAAAVTVVVV